MRVYTDQETWELFKSADIAGFDLLYRQYSQALYAYGMKICADEETTQDVIHDLFVELWSRNRRLPDVANIRSYLLKAMRNKLLKQMNSATMLSIDDLPDNTFPLTFSPEAGIIQNEDDRLTSARLQMALSKLTERQREILYLKFNEGLSHTDIAEIMQINYQSVVNIVYRTMTALKKHMNLSTAVLIYFLGLTS